MDIAAVVLGATGYVGGELLRLVGGHPEFRLAAAVSGSHGGEALGRVFPHLAAMYPDATFARPGTWAERVDSGSRVALFSAAPHGAAAGLVAGALEQAQARGLEARVVDCSADFRYPTAEAYQAVYGIAHEAPGLLPEFVCALPEQLSGSPSRHVGHPGCFATAMLLAAVPLLATGDVIDDELFITGITGSTGSGREAQPGTHHPERHSNLYAYKPLVHRHVPEVVALIRNACAREARINFVPHSGPFARGIHVTVQAKLSAPATGEEMRAAFRSHYAQSEFVHVVDGTPRLKDVVAGNHCHLGIDVAGDTVVVTGVIDNLVKGAAGGALQWMNRLWALPEGSGLGGAAPAWT